MSVSVKAGGYAVNSEARPWISEPIKKATAKSRKQKAEPTVRSPVLMEAANSESDPFWAGMMRSASLGNLPKGFLLRTPKNDDPGTGLATITYKKGTKVWQLPIPECTEELRQSFRDFFRSFGMSSPDDHVVHPAADQDDGPQTWKDVRNKKKLRDLLIDDFASSQVEKYNLNAEERLRMLRVLRLGFALGRLDDCVVFEDDCIQDITNFVFDPDTRNFTIQHENRTPATRARGGTSKTSIHNNNTECETETQASRCRKPQSGALEERRPLCGALEERKFRLLHPSTKNLCKAWETYIHSFLFPMREERQGDILGA